MDFDELPDHVLELIFSKMQDKDLGRYVDYENPRLKKLALTFLANRYRDKMILSNAEFKFIGIKSNGNLVMWKNRLKKPAVQKYKAVYSSENVLYLSEDGKLTMIGHRNEDGEKNIPKLDPVKKVSYNHGTVLVLTETNKVIGWGNNYDKLNIPPLTKKPIDVFNDFSWSAVLLEGGYIQGWGESWENPPEEIQGKIKQFKGNFNNFLALLNNGTLVGWGWWFKSEKEPDWFFRRTKLIPDIIQGRIILICSINDDGYSVLLEDGILYIRKFGSLAYDNEEMEQIPAEYQGRFIGHIWKYEKHFGLLSNGDVVRWPKKSPKISLF